MPYFPENSLVSHNGPLPLFFRQAANRGAIEEDQLFSIPGLLSFPE